MSRIPYLRSLLSGKHHVTVFQLHKKYGPIVRIAPNELAFSDAEAWRDIMGHKNNAEEFPKYRPLYRPGRAVLTPQDIIYSGRDEHAALRRQLSHGFSDKAMRAQEPRILQFVDLLIKRLHQWNNNGKSPIRMDSWYNFTTFDIIGDLAFGDSFNCLESSDYHEWVKCIFELSRLGVYFQVEDYYPLMKRIVNRMLPNRALERQSFHNTVNKAKLQKRIEGGDRDDLIEGLLKKKDEWNLSMEQLESNSTLLVIAGSETTATVLSGVTYLLASNPHTLERLTDEVRSTFDSEDEITIESASRLRYMLACLDETLRIYPPVATSLPRITPEKGGIVAGTFFPRGTVVGVHHWAVYHMEEHFKDPFNFHPERFLGDPKFANDNRKILQPFHVGPRNCIGRNLAYAEMRLILARVVYNFDMKLASESSGWLNQRAFTLWEKNPLMVYLTPRTDKEKSAL
ncbi:cytochrome P450 ClCP1 [Metarhizium album ARSEF 1941]|uniref:Cytochrome P450 ClCP1 n=1 Tax=Metarhizium album (strain ARSEF 1941) TaxID=1081103 RepID=A0A0B2WE32_METAS|nr:cytochrome P450 ClCP1 [Metarhizium album ARSEF 1941]KHN94126.1 cytochrome P450 ClCP1 [Metarhizium album ARSEF 1941]